jgi:hypothetical protein
MANTTLTADIIAKEALLILENELSVLKTLHRAHEDEFSQTVNGYKVGDTISIRRPADFTVRTGANISTQDVIEGKTTLVIDQQRGVDFAFSSTDLTLKINDLSERVIKPAMSSLINNITSDVLTQMYLGAYNWVGTPSGQVNSFADFAKGAERLDEMAAPQDNRHAVLSPADYWSLLGSQTALYINGPAQDAYRAGNLGNIGGINTMMSQVTPTHTNGTADGTTPLVKGASQEVTYDTAKNTWTQSLLTDGWDASATITKGTVFTIDGIFMVNPKTKASTGILQQFVVTADVTAQATTTNTTTLTISPPIIVTGPHQTVTYSGDMDDNPLVLVGAASTGYRQNMVYHKNAMALAMVPMEMPQAAYNGSRQTYKGMSVRIIPIYNGATDISSWRLDVLFGRKLIDPRLVCRLSGTS